VACSKFPQGPRNLKGHWHDHPFVRRDGFAEPDLLRDVIADDDDNLRGVGVETRDVSSKTAFRMQATGGSPSSILCQVRPSSVEPKSLPLRVPK
jgi:hypothetical protein